MIIEPAYTIYIDATNTPLFNENIDFIDRPYIICAVLVPFTSRETILKALPRDPITNKFLKSSSRRMSDKLCAEFLSVLLKTEVKIAVCGIDAGGKVNPTLAKEISERANAARKHFPLMKKSTILYFLVAKEVLINVWAQFITSTREGVSYMNVIFDREDLKQKVLELFQNMLRSAFTRQNMTLHRVSWCSREQEPLLLVPDYIAGAYKRKITHDDCPNTWKEIEKALKNKQIAYQDGWKSKI